MNAQFPISVETLQAGLPHRPPMVWVSRVLEADAQGGTCELDLDPGAHYFSENGVRQSALIEWMAQSFGYALAGGAEKISSTAYLAAVTNVEYCDEMAWKKWNASIKKGDRVLIQVRAVRILASITMIEGNVKTIDGLTLVKAQMKVFVIDGSPVN